MCCSTAEPSPPGPLALLSGCATVGARRASRGCTPLAPVIVDDSRVIRTMAGLRPYRRQGFVVRPRQLGEKRLVHNYGHGGGGITLSWGTSKLATELGLQGHSGPVAVLGSGAVGLATARLVQEAGFPVTIYAAALPPDTTSNVAGGQFHPFAVFHEGDVTPEFMAQFTRALDYSWRRFQIMVGDDYGIRWLPTYVEPDSPEAKLIADLPADQPDADRVPSIRSRRQHAALRHDVRRDRPLPSPDDSRRADRRRQDRGPQVRDAGRHRDASRRASSSTAPASAAATCSAIRICTRPAASSPSSSRSRRSATPFTGGPGYMFPRPDGIILGGTFELDQWDTTPEPGDDRPHPRRSHKRFFASFRCAA